MSANPNKSRIELIISQLQSGSRLTEGELKDLQSTIESSENLRQAAETHHETTKHHTKSALALQDVLEQFGRNQ